MLAFHIILSQDNRTIEKTLLHRKQKGNQWLGIAPNNEANCEVRYNYAVYTFLIITSTESDACFIVSNKRWSMFRHGLK